LYVIVTNWNSLIINGSWKGSTAGGCRNFPTFTDNPQYAIDLTEDADGDGKCSVLIALMQKNRRQQKKLGVRDLCIGYAVYKVTLLFLGLILSNLCMHRLPTAKQQNLTKSLWITIAVQPHLGVTLILVRCLLGLIWILDVTSSSPVHSNLKKRETSF